MKKKILLLTYAFPPTQAAESYLSAKALAKLKSFDVDVLTIDPADFGLRKDYSLTQYIEKNFKNVYRVNAPFWMGKFLFRLLKYLIPFPDRFSALNRSMLKEALMIDIPQYSLIISWSQWHSIHLVARKIKKSHPEIPWVVHMSDPWADNPFLPKLPALYYIQRFFEQMVIRNADHINFTNELTLDLVMEKYPKTFRSKASFFPHAFDLTLYERSIKNEENSVNFIRYLGNFYGQRNTISFTKAVADLFGENPDLFVNVKIELVGQWVDNPGWRPQHSGLPLDIMEFRLPVSYRDSLRLMSEAAVLLVIDAPFDESVFLPSKLVDYMGAKRPILAFTPKGCTSNTLLKLGGYVESPLSISSIKKGLEKVLIDLKDGTLREINQRSIESFSVHTISSLYEKLFTSLASR